VPLSTENAGALTGKPNTTKGIVTVEILIGTFVKSVGRDVQVGETVEISDEDARFLLPYAYAKVADTQAPVESNEVATDTTPKTVTPQGKRTN
jgi:hypothetical protein